MWPVINNTWNRFPNSIFVQVQGVTRLDLGAPSRERAPSTKFRSENSPYMAQDSLTKGNTLWRTKTHLRRYWRDLEVGSWSGLWLVPDNVTNHRLKTRVSLMFSKRKKETANTALSVGVLSTGWSHRSVVITRHILLLVAFIRSIRGADKKGMYSRSPRTQWAMLLSRLHIRGWRLWRG